VPQAPAPAPVSPLVTHRRSTLGPILAMALVAIAAVLGVFALGHRSVTQTASSVEQRDGDATAERREGSAQFGVEQVLLPNRSASRAAPAPLSGYTLSGIAAFQDHYVAVVNGHVVKAGDPVGDARVIAISAKAVELDVNGERQIIELIF